MTLRNLIPVTTAAALLMAAPSAMADGLRNSYAGFGVAVGLNGQGVNASLVGRAAVDLDSVMMSFRPQVNIGSSVEGAVGTTLDVPVARETNLYVGGGVAFRDEASSGLLTAEDATVGYVQAGAESSIAPRTTLFFDWKVGLSGEARVVPTLGLAYQF